MSRIYDRQNWRQLPRDGDCVGPALLGGECSGTLHLHHVHDAEDSLLMLCSRHHAALHGVRRRLTHWRSCPHQHRTREAREACERRLNLTAA